jgi:predicted RNA binding protein YcfA (HicA-like mRNA interferase family)
MVKPSKLYQRIVEAPTRPIAFRLFEKCVISFGFTHVRSRGSHQVFEHPQVPRPLILQQNGKDANISSRSFLIWWSGTN